MNITPILASVVSGLCLNDGRAQGRTKENALYL
jgi:hypothetical protein